ncbi:septal ring lytic transglycosylase RlpA family protein [Massilia sp. PWRC2]|uniref:septal ring lytic transglycosylase RlpA family protein n=1 Tax=Massilia sp. PWRC2 TaxID=2804626 RepID=UPI003CE97773
MKQLPGLIAAWTVAAGFAILFSGCASTDSKGVIPPPLQHTAPVDHADLQPLLPAAGAGGGAYYKDDGPGAHPPSRLDLVPDAIFQAEPIAKSGNRPYSALGQTYLPLQGDAPYSQQGVASWYGRKFHGKRTASGERYDMYKMSAAHPTLPIPSYVRITNLETGRHVIVRVNDRGPFLGGRLIDVSYAAALKLGMLKAGRQHVQVDRILASDSERIGTLRREAHADESTAPDDIKALMLEDRMVDAELR